MRYRELTFASVMLAIAAVACCKSKADSQASSWMVYENPHLELFNGSQDGTLTLYGKPDGARTAIDIGPTRGALPTQDALSELCLYRTQDQSVNFERMSFAGLADGRWRFGVERGGTGQWRPISFGFENVPAGQPCSGVEIALDHILLGTSTLQINTLALNSAPVNGATPAAWLPVTVNGQLYYWPLYR